MGKHGPCYHCGVTSTPLWRNGPPEKPVLCNACGSRWRTKGTLANYTPLHSRADPDEYEDHRATRMKTISVSKSKEEKVLKRKQNYDTGFVGGFLPDYNQGLQKGLDEDTSNRSSSGSAISNPESCALFGSSADGSDMTGQAQSVVWESMIPSRKRTCVTRQKSSSVEKLTKDLYAILHEQQSSSLSECSEEDLLFESETPMVSVEIGHGSVLFRHPSSIARDEESEASSLSVENKQCFVSEAYSHSLTIQQKKAETVIVPGAELNNPIWGGTYAEHLMRDKYLNERIDVMGNPHSLLCNIDLSDVLTFKEFGNLTIPEQQRLLQYLPPSDAAKIPGSVKVLFESPQFKGDISSYQQLLAEGQAGAFDLSFAGAKAEDSDAPKRLELSNLWKSKWVEHYNLLENCRSVGRFPLGRGMSGVASTNLVSAKRLPDSDTQKVPDARTMKSPRRIIIKETTDNKEHLDSESSLFSPRSLFALPPDSSSMMLDSLPCADENPDQDLLLDIPSNGSFAQAELLHPTKSSPQASASSSLVYPRPFHPYL